MKTIKKLFSPARKRAVLNVCAVGVMTAMMCACSKEGGKDSEIKEPWVDTEEEWTSESMKITFSLNGPFRVETEAMTRATAQESGMTDIWVLDYQNEGTDETPLWTLKQHVHQTSTDEGFGSPQMELPYGAHRIISVAGKGDGAALSVGTTDGHSLSWTRVKDTFVKDCPLDVVSGMSGNVSVTLERAVGAVTLKIKDAIPAIAKTIGITMDRSQMLMLPSLETGEPSASEVVSEIPATWAGKTNKLMTVYTLCDTEAEFTTDVRIVAKDVDGNVISDFTVEDVAVKRNRQTVLNGEVFRRNKTMSITLNTEWEEDSEVEF